MTGINLIMFFYAKSLSHSKAEKSDRRVWIRIQTTGPIGPPQFNIMLSLLKIEKMLG